MNWTLAAFAIGAYLLGSIPTGLIAGKLLRGVDIREYGSGKTGTTNTLRTLGRGPALAVLIADLLKGALPVLLARLATDDAWVHAAAGLAAIIGHDWPVFAGFRGGRGVATTFGALLALMPLLALPLIALGGVIVYRSRIVSLMSILGAATGGVAVILLAVAERVPVAYAAFGVVAALLILALHRDNIARLRAGVEPRIGQGGERRQEHVGVRS